MSDKIVVSGVGCSLVDRIYNSISFNSESFKPFLSKEKGDGGLSPGQLVFREEFEKFIGDDLDTVLQRITGGRRYDKINIGGPGIVAMIHAAQLSNQVDCEYRFYGARGNDDNGEFIISRLEKKTTVEVSNYLVKGKETPYTLVLSDPGSEGIGERIFINSIGAAWNYSPEDLNNDFFDSDITVFGGTALVPTIHDNLTELLKKSKQNGAVTIVNTVYDFRNMKKNPERKWPLGRSDESYRYIDLLIMDLEEAIHLSGEKDMDHAIRFFQEKGTGAVIITSGMENIRLYSQGKLFEPLSDMEMPVSKAIVEELKKMDPLKGDTTGCGDNFVGGVIASLVSQLSQTDRIPDLYEAAIWGIVSGGSSCFYLGGMFEEKYPGEKRSMIEPYFEKYIEQVGVKKQRY